MGARGILLSVLLAPFSFGLAQERLSLTLTPVRLELQEAGEGTARLENTGAEGVTLEVEAFPFLLRLDGSLHPAPSHERDLCPHLSVFPQGRVSLGKGESLFLRVQVQPFAGRGTYWCGVGLTTLPSPEEEGGLQALLRLRLVLPVYMTFSGTEEPKLEVGALGRKGDELHLLLQNRGNALLRVTGSLLIYDREGKEVGRLPVPEVPLLPGGGRVLSFKPELPPGPYRVLLLLEHPYGRLALEGEW